MATAAKRRGAAGAVLDGYARDTQGILELRFPTFCHGSYGQDQRGRGQVVAYREPLTIQGVRVNPGDILVGDVDGVVVLPQELEVSVITQAVEQALKENTARTMLQNGAFARDVFTRTGVL
jgi:regulator of RNase E activity RraA